MLQLAACRSDAERAEMADVARVASLVDRLRDADNADKQRFLAALESSPCRGASACSLKDLCVRAYSQHQKALDEAASIRHALGEPDAGTRVEAQLRAAKNLLEEARTLTLSCSERQVDAVRRTLIR